MNCISCGEPTIHKPTIKWIERICVDCDISHRSGYAYRRIGSEYRVDWFYFDDGGDYRETIICKRSNIDNRISDLATLNGLKLFDVRTEEQLEKLLILL
jgi:hypothetical protein